MEKSNEFTRLVARIRAGDERALERLLAAVAGPMRRIAASYIGNALRLHVDADDLVQRVALILWHGLRAAKFDISSPHQLLSLARTLLKREAAKAVQKFQAAMNAMTSTAELDLGATLVDQRVMPATCPAKKAEATDQIQQLMKRVNAHDRRMLELLLQGHTIAGAARTLKIEPAALRMRLSRLRIRVRRVHTIRVEVRKALPVDKLVEPPAP